MKARDISAVALFSGFIAILGFFPPVFVPFFPLVPLSLHALAVILAAAVLGAKRSFYAVAIYWLLLLCGFAFAGGSSGAAAFIGPMGGYIWGFGLTAYAIGRCYDHCPNPGRTREFFFMALGTLLLYAAGIAWLAILTEMPLRHIIFLNLLFLPGDCLKIFIAIALRRSLLRASPKIFR